nr:ABC transporter substrate-binding protein [Stackebrandtia nassauensis]
MKIGWEIPKSGTYETLGKDLDAAFNLYLDTHGGKLGGRKVELKTVDETDKPEKALDAANKLIKQDEVVAMAGIQSSGSYEAIAPVAQENGIPLVGAGGRPQLEKNKDLDGLKGLWHTSWINAQTGQSIAPYIKKKIDGPVYAIGPDYEGGYANVEGFTDEFKKIGGKLANEKDGKPTYTPFPKIDDFGPYLTKIANSDAKAVYCFYAGANAIDFVKQYAESDAADIPLYGAFYTEGKVLEAQGKSAKGMYSTMNYSPDLDNEANREYVAEWTKKEQGQPSVYATAAWDAAQVLDLAIGSIPKGEEVTSEAITEAIGKLGKIKSPRGEWHLGEKTHAPIQKWYLREVKEDGGVLSNVRIEDLETLGS